MPPNQPLNVREAKTPSLNRFGILTSDTLSDATRLAHGAEHDRLVSAAEAVLDAFRQASERATADQNLSPTGKSGALRQAREAAEMSIGKLVDARTATLRGEARKLAEAMPTFAPHGGADAERRAFVARDTQIHAEARAWLRDLDPLEREGALREAAEAGEDGRTLLLALDEIGPHLRAILFRIDADTWSGMLRRFGQAVSPTKFADLESTKEAIQAAEGVGADARAWMRTREASIHGVFTDRGISAPGEAPEVTILGSEEGE